jgi:hypothetical protein
MDVTMRVHTVSVAPVEVDVEYNGEKARAMIPDMAVELMALDGQHGTWTVHFRSHAEMAEAKTMFKQGDVVKVSLSKAAPEAIETTAADSEPAVASEPAA